MFICPEPPHRKSRFVIPSNMVANLFQIRPGTVVNAYSQRTAVPCAPPPVPPPAITRACLPPLPVYHRADFEDRVKESKTEDTQHALIKRQLEHSRSIAYELAKHYYQVLSSGSAGRGRGLFLCSWCALLAHQPSKIRTAAHHKPVESELTTKGTRTSESRKKGMRM